MNKCRTRDDVLDLHREMVAYFTKCIQDLKKEHVISRSISRLMDYIDQHLHERIKLDQLAEYADLSPNYLSVLFKKETGISVSEYIQRRKLEVAENMLMFSDYSSAEISSFLAFNSQSYFIQAFQKKNGMTPKEFRNRKYNHHISHGKRRTKEN